uniref:protein SdhA n=1 Tax=Legionella sp. km772 TaxID=2498111 RepID=UPI000F8EF072|nr:protein SdhA [Legionella sp. km772]RUR09231.1 protein SdhA [Legionella sp. km772]
MLTKLEEGIELLESFKTHKISSLIDQINLKVFAALRSSKLNPQVASYFADLPIDPAIKDLEPTPANAEKIKKILADYYGKMPLKGYETEPENVTQIKKMLNALYYAHNSFTNLENLNLRQGIIKDASELYNLYQKTIDDTYEASYLLTHLDVDVQEMFQEELQLIYPAIATLGKFVEQNSEQTKLLAENIRKFPISYAAGEITGTALEQMQPSSGSLDYNFLTQFSASLPSYIDKVTQYVQQHSSQLIAQEPGLNNAKVEELQNTALALLNDLENLKSSNRFFLSFKALKYIHIISNIITLSKSSLEQIGHLNESSQDVIRDNLAQLKYEVFPQLFGLVDKIEVNCMLKPGTLSAPLMEKVKPLYDTLIHYAKKPVNFEARGEELLTIEDSRFVSLRLEKTYQRIDAANKALFKIKKIDEAGARFYTTLKSEQYKNLALSELPQEIKTQLIEDYKIIKPYMSQINADFNELIIHSLQGTSAKGYLASAWDWFKGKISSTTPLPDDHMSYVLATEELFNKLVTKKTNTQKFHIDLNKNLIESVLKTTDLTLYPYSDATSVITAEQLEKIPAPHFPPERTQETYFIDETIALRIAGEHNPRIKLVGEVPLKTIVNPELLSGDQTLALYQWYKDKSQRLEKAQKAYNQFVDLLAEQIQEYYPIPPHVLNFNQLHEPHQKQLRALYQEFRTHFLDGVPAEMQTLATSFDKFLNPTPIDSPLLAPPVLGEFNKLDEHFQTFFEDTESRWNKKTQFYLKQAKHKFASEEQNVFFVDESRALRAAGELNPSLKFSKEQGKKLVADPEQLTSNQALTLHQWYRNKRDKLEIAQKAYEQFIKLLNEQAQKHPDLGSAKFTLKHLEPEVKIECRKLYNLFQSYFINGMPEAGRQEALEFDRYLVHSFAQDKTTDKAPSLDIFAKYNDHFQVYFTDMDLTWRRKSQAYSNLAQEKLASENKKASLAHDANADRAHYLIKHTHYSNFVYEFRQSLQQLTTKFNAAMQEELKIKSATGVPYPELQDKYLAKAQSKQVLAIKEIYNGLYHAEQLIRELENLNDKSHKAIYVLYLIKAYSQINELVKLSKSLSQDEHLKLISGELLEKAQNLWATIQENIEPYQEAAADVAPLDKNVKFNGLWYTLNTFYVIPKHIRSLRNASTLTQDDLDKVHVSAKKAALSIEAIINSSDSYFKLFLQAPNMLRLFREFKGQLKEFISTVHDTATSNLGEFNTKIFTPMLLEADQWEDQLGLAPGTFSGPLKKMLEEYYKGLLHPLNLPSKTHLDFVCDKTPITIRKQIAQQKVDDAKAHLEKTESNYAELIKLNALIEEYNTETGSILFAPDKDKVNQLMVKIAAAYKEALPRLVALNRQLAFTPNPKISEEDIKFDAQLNAGLKDYDYKLSDIRALVKISHAHYLGLKNTYKMKESSAQEKITYLTELNAAQDIANERFILAYTTESFDKQCKELAYRRAGLQYVHKEYSEKLEADLLRYKAGIIHKAKSEEDINQSIRALLIEKIEDFERKNFAQYYKLDRIQVALAQFSNYFSLSSSSVYENDKTIRKKSAEIDKLLTISKNELLSVEERIKRIHQTVEKDPSFSRIILEEKPLEAFSFDYFKSCILFLLRILHIYTPEKDANLRDLKKATKEEHSISDLSKRFGLFAVKKKEEELAPEDQASLQGDESPVPPLSSPP